MANDTGAALADDVAAEARKRAYACDCVERALPIYETLIRDDDRPRAAVEAARKWLRGEINDDELEDARTNALDAGNYAWHEAHDALREPKTGDYVYAGDAAAGKSRYAPGAAEKGAVWAAIVAAEKHVDFSTDYYAASGVAQAAAGVADAHVDLEVVLAGIRSAVHEKARHAEPWPEINDNEL
ncbi:MAG: hypothetical protein LBT97_03050 [Planctomycetota bacterium]|nr:hypothetical protein [Planctomycetota bacterium]